MTTPICPICLGRRTVATVDFDGRTACPCPNCTVNEARAALGRSFGTDQQRCRLWQRRRSMRAPR